MGASGYSVLASYYDRLMGDVPYSRWAKFIAGFARSLSRPDVKVLDVGCGTGTIALDLAKRGFLVTGIDSSIDMLEIAQAKSRGMGLPVNWKLGSFCSISDQADLVISTCDGVNHLLSIKELVGFTKSAYVCLADEGYLIFDINSPAKYQLTLGNRLFSWGSPELHVIWRNFYVPPFNQAAITLFQRGTKHISRFQILQRCYTPSSLVYYLKQTGFSNIQLWDNYKTRLKTMAVPRITVVAQKNKGR